MSFLSAVVSLEWNRNNLVLKRGDSVLLIDAEKIQSLRVLKEAKEFEEFWRTQALQNREARRVFEAWERKDAELMSKVHKEVIA
ncbi:MAG: hypothetical protein IOD12_13970 [Silvanigrellales bacterium]|nr:hypothetical protein [Silvanigrellales bacterium]